MNLPNKLTIMRMVLAFVFIVFLFIPGLAAKVLALATFVVASATDFLDGYLAKKNHQIPDFGALMDTIADKVLILSAFLAFVQMQYVKAWMVAVILFREVAVTGLRIMALTKGRIITADHGGKHKTVCQVIAIFFILLVIILKEAAPAFWSKHAEGFCMRAIFALMILTVTLTLISGVSYLIRNREVYTNAKKS